MDESQVTGSTSSYARKYALNGLFAIDDNKDADTLNNHADFTNQPVAQAAIQQGAQNYKIIDTQRIHMVITDAGIPEESLNGLRKGGIEVVLVGE